MKTPSILHGFHGFRATALVMLLAGAGAVCATNHEIRINEVMAGLNGDSSIQFVEIVVQGDGQKVWGPGPHPLFPGNNPPVGRAMLTFHDAAGRQVGRFVFPSNAPSGARTVLIATREFANLTGIAPDFIMPMGIIPVAGKICFAANPDALGAQFDVTLCLSYGGAGFTGPTDGAGSANPAALPILGAQSLRRFRNFDEFSFGPGTQFNVDFSLGPPTPSSTRDAGVSAADTEENRSGERLLPVEASVVEQGRTLFMRETFLGNGRTCATCHRPEEDFGLTAARVGSLSASDPLFVHELNVNRLVVNHAGSTNPAAPSGGTQPSDFWLGGTITGSVSGAGSAVILAGSGSTYLVVGGASLNVPGNVLADTHGNKGTLVSFTPGTLGGLENSTLLRGGRALILENINGFDQAPFMRGSPPLINAQHTAPFGLSGEFSNLRVFSAGAVQQHFPRGLGRVAGVDFREPTAEELQALESFQRNLLGPADATFDDANHFDRFATTEEQKRGRDLFFGGARCGVCHNGPALATSSGEFDTRPGVNESFNTGVARLPLNTADGLPTEQDRGQPPNTRLFSTQGLFGVRKTAPYFHDHSKATLTEAIQFYDSPQFRASPAGQQIGGIDATNFIADNVSALRMFLESLVDTPFTFTRRLNFGTACGGGGAGQTLSFTIANAGTNALSIGNVRLVGSQAGAFVLGAVLSDRGPFGNGEARTVGVTFNPAAAGTFAATLEFDVIAGTEIYSAGTVLSGATDLIVQSGLVHVDCTFNGSDPDGTMTAPYPTVGEGVQAACAGSTLRISGCNYLETLTIRKPLRLEGKNGIVNIGTH